MCGSASGAEIVVTVNDAGSSPPFSISPGYSISYTPGDGIGPPPDGYTYWLNWVPSTNFGNTGFNAIQSHYVLGQAPQLDILVSSLNPQSYEVFAQVFVNTGQFPGIGDQLIPAYGSRLGLVADNLTTYSYASGGSLQATGDSAPSTGQYQIREFSLGNAFAADGKLHVYLADFHTVGQQVTATLAGLRIVAVPEPSTAGMAAIGAAGLVVAAIRRQRLRAALL
jgi:hypothetical protein